MASQTCGQCGASVASDEQFCPQCGSFIDPLAPSRPTAPPSTGRPSTRPGNVISISPDGNKYEEFSLQEPPPEAQQRAAQPPRKTNGDMIECPSCSAPNPASNRHCQQCGARLQQGALPTAPRPAVQTTAGVRAAVAISILFFGVVLAVVLFNFFSNDPSADSTTTTEQSTSTTAASVENTPQTILRQDCDPPGIGSLTCSNLTDGDLSSEYQVNWEALSAVEGGKIEITLSFSVATIVDRIEWVNIANETRFKQNYRARGISIVADNALSSLPVTLNDEPGAQFFNFAAVDANSITIEVVSAFNAEVVDGNRWAELAIAEIIVWGRPSNG